MSLVDDMIVFRATHGMSQSDLARACDLTRQTIGNVENGVQKPSKLTEAKIRLVIGKEKK